MVKKVSASDAKNNFGGLLDDVAVQGRVDIMRHGRLVAVVVSPRMFDVSLGAEAADSKDSQWGRKHMIAPQVARGARMLNQPSTFDEE